MENIRLWRARRYLPRRVIVILFSLCGIRIGMCINYTLAYPERQMDMVRSMVDMYREHGWLPKWELYGRETLTMEGDPSIPVIVDSWMKGLRDFDVELV